LRAAVAKIRKNWYSVIPREALPPTLKQGKVVLEFAILKDREVKNLRYSQGSGDVALDRAAYAGITASNPFPPLPSEFTGDHLGIRFTFKYNPGPEDSKLPPLSAEAANEQVRLSEILISTRGCPLCGTPQQLSAAVARCEALLQQIRGGAKFEDVARASSDGSTAAQGGDLGYFPRGRLAKSIEDVVFAMKVDDVSDVIQTNQGFIILRLTEHVGVKSTAPTTPN
jgi:TonB family protein